MKTKSMIAAALLCLNRPPRGTGATTEGESTSAGAGGVKTEEVVAPHELERLRKVDSEYSGIMSRISSLGSTLATLGLALPGDDVLSIAGSVASRVAEAERTAKAVEQGAKNIAEVVETLYKDRCIEGATILSITEAILREHAEKCKGLPAANDLVEGSSAIDQGDDGKGVQTGKAFRACT
jgi:hypothetical protein